MGGFFIGENTRLTDSAEREYFNLRERINVNIKQISGLQQYIKEHSK
ncbi:lysis system i-spanin subunit Rz [Rahnella sp. Larv3_ips]